MNITTQDLVQHVDDSIARAEASESKLGEWELSIPGMSSPAVRHLLNNLLNIPAPVRYMEVGTYKGSTLVAAATCNPQITATAIDDFSWAARKGKKETQGRLKDIRESLSVNIAGIRGGGDVRFIEGDFWALDAGELRASRGPFDVYFYDGGHSRGEQRRAVVEKLDLLGDLFLLIVDDYDERQARHGTQAGLTAIKNAGLAKEVKTWYLSRDEDRGNHFSERFWWNGIFIGVFQK